MSRRTQFVVFIVLLGVLAAVVFNVYRSSDSEKEQSTQPISLNAKFTPLGVDNPALRLDILQRFLALEYKGVHRNIFSATLPPPPAPPPSKQQMIVATPPPSGPPPLTVDAKYFGYVSDYGGSHRRAFFATGGSDDIIIAGEGDTFMGRFRVIHLTNTAADVEEVATGRRATLTLEEPSPAG